MKNVKILIKMKISNYDENFDLDYTKNLQSYRVFNTDKYAELHKKIEGFMSKNTKTNKNNRRKCIIRIDLCQNQHRGQKFFDMINTEIL